MSAQYLSIHPQDPQPRSLKQVAKRLQQGALIIYPTDGCYALGCALEAVSAIQRMRRARGLDDHHHLTLICRDLSEISHYALVDDWQFRLLKKATPGRFTFLLPATKAVPKRFNTPSAIPLIFIFLTTRLCMVFWRSWVPP